MLTALNSDLIELANDIIYDGKNCFNYYNIRKLLLLYLYCLNISIEEFSSDFESMVLSCCSNNGSEPEYVVEILGIIMAKLNLNHTSTINIDLITDEELKTTTKRSLEHEMTRMMEISGGLWSYIFNFWKKLRSDGSRHLNKQV